MNEKNIIQSIEGYVSYFNFMHRTKLKFYINPHLKEIEIREKTQKTTRIMVYFYYGNIKSGLQIRVFFYNDDTNIINQLKKQYGESKIDQRFNIVSMDKLHMFFQIAEEGHLFKKK